MIFPNKEAYKVIIHTYIYIYTYSFAAIVECNLALWETVKQLLFNSRKQINFPMWVYSPIKSLLKN